MSADRCTRRCIRATSIRRIAAGAALFAAPTTALAQGATDLYLISLRPGLEGVAVDSVVRLTDRDGYDNQPHLLPDGRNLLYTSIDAAGQADIMRLDLVTRAVTNVTRSAPESEYSAALMPSGDRLSVIRVERDSTQRLWSFRLDGSDPALVLEDLKPVGYQAWIDADRIAVFVLGNPATLQLADVRTGSARVIASDIGRSLNAVPGRAAVSFVDRTGDGPGRISVFDVDVSTTEPLIRAMSGNEYHVWTPSGALLTAEGSVLYRWLPGRDGDWVPLADLSAAGITGISRMAISRDGRQLVVVAGR